MQDQNPTAIRALAASASQSASSHDAWNIGWVISRRATVGEEDDWDLPDEEPVQGAAYPQGDVEQDAAHSSRSGGRSCR